MNPRPTINIAKTDCMFDAEVDISLSGFAPNHTITLHSFTKIDNGSAFECTAVYETNEAGVIDLKRDSSIGGSFLGVEPMGLFWAMKPSLSNMGPYARMVKMDVTTPMVVSIFAYDGAFKTLESIEVLRKKKLLGLHELTSVNVNRWLMAPGTKRISLTLESCGIIGTLFVPPGHGPFPGVLVMFGGYRGTLEFKAALLASHGFAALALAYVGLPGLPNLGLFTELELEYFERAVHFLSNHDSVDKKAGIGIISLSFSSFIALAIAENVKNIKCVVWLNGFVYPMFGRITYKNKVYKEQPFSREIEDCVKFISKNNPLVTCRIICPTHTDPFHPDLKKSMIKFYERHDVAHMFIAGLSDANVASEYCINQAEKLLKFSKHPDYVLLRYPGAGHLIEPCYGIHHYITSNKFFNVFMEWGGETHAHCKAQEDSWHKQINFLKSNLIVKHISKL